MDKKAMMAIVANMCAYQSASCRGLDMADMARQLLDMASVPANATIYEIPVSDNNQVIVYFYIPGDDNYYSLLVGDGADGSKANFILYIEGKNPGTSDFYFLDDSTEIDINYFKREDKGMMDRTVKNLVDKMIDAVIARACTVYEIPVIFTEDLEDARRQIERNIFSLSDADFMSEEDACMLLDYAERETDKYLEREGIAVMDYDSVVQTEVLGMINRQLVAFAAEVRKADADDPWGDTVRNLCQKELVDTSAQSMLYPSCVSLFRAKMAEIKRRWA